VVEYIFTASLLSENYLPRLKSLLEQSNWKIEEIGVIGVDLGPGSFTGLRVGLSIAKGFSLPYKIPVVGVSTFEVIAYNFYPSSLPLLILIPCRRGEVFFCKGRWEEERMKIISEEVVRLEDIRFRVTSPTLITGEGSLIYREELKELLGNKAIFSPPTQSFPRPSTVCLLAEKRWREVSWEEGISLSPRYLKYPTIRKENGSI